MRNICTFEERANVQGRRLSGFKYMAYGLIGRDFGVQGAALCSMSGFH